jgi:regulator of protease activity HflC (stomatin/prohibitin superfamily)
MQDYLNRQLTQYGVRILGANIPDVQLPDQYQQHLATRERVAKELAAYEREWALTRKQRIDTLLMEIERSKKDRDARLIEVKEARNRACQDVARMLEEKETEAQRVRLGIETCGRQP